MSPGRSTASVAPSAYGGWRTLVAGVALIASLLGAGTAEGTEGARYEIPLRIDRTGTVDVTTDLLNFFASVPNGSTIVFPAGARYRVEGTLVVRGRRLTFEGNGATVFATTPGDRGRRHWWFRGGGPIAVRDLIVKGANPHAGTGDAAWDPDREAQHGFDFESVQGVTLERVTVTDVYGDFLYFGGVWKTIEGVKRFVWTRNAVVRDSIFERNGRQGMTANAVDGLLFQRNRLGQVRRSTIDIEPNSTAWGARNVKIANNVFGPSRLNFVAGVGAGGTVRDIQIVDNRLEGKAMRMDLRGKPDARRGPITIARNVSNSTFSSSRALLELSYFDGIVIEGNVQPFKANRTMTAVLLEQSCAARIANNQFKGATTIIKKDGYVCPAVQGEQDTRDEPQPPPPAPAPTTIPVPPPASEPNPVAVSTAAASDQAPTAAPTSVPGPAPHHPVDTNATEPADVTPTSLPPVLSGAALAEPLREARLADDTVPGRALPAALALLLLLGVVMLQIGIGVPLLRPRR